MANAVEQGADTTDSFDALLESLVSEASSTRHHGKPGLPAAAKRRWAERLRAVVGAGDPPPGVARLLTHPLASAREVGAILLPETSSAAAMREWARNLALDEDWEVREWAVEPLVQSLAPDAALDLAALMEEGGRIRRAAVLAARSLIRGGRLDAEAALMLAECVVDDPDPYVQANVGGFLLGDAVAERYPEELSSWLQARVRSQAPSPAFWKNVTALYRSAGALRTRPKLRSAAVDLLAAGAPRGAATALTRFIGEGAGDA